MDKIWTEPLLNIFLPGISIFILTLLYIFIWNAQASKPTSQVRQVRPLTLRVEDISVDISREEFETDIKIVVENDPTLQKHVARVTHHHLTRRNLKKACATVTFYTSIPADQLIRQLLSHPKFAQTCRFDTKFLGITPLYEPPEGGQVDVIAVPGLGSHPIGSWRSPTGNDMWLRDYLPEDIPGVRVLVYGYDTSVLGDSRDSIEDLGIRFLESLKAFRQNTADHRPIVFVGHSLGGLLIKEALYRARKRAEERQNRFLFTSCYGFIFFGVPNLGLRNEQLRSIVQGRPNKRLIEDLVVDNEGEPSNYLKSLSDRFAHACKNQYKVVSFFERKESATVEIKPDGTLTKNGPKVYMVTEQSATSTGLIAAADEDNIPLNLDHSGLVKYENRSQDEYSIVKTRLMTLVDEAIPSISKRFEDNCESSPQDMLSKIRYHIERVIKCRVFVESDFEQGSLEDITWFTHTTAFSSWKRSEKGILWNNIDRIDTPSPLLPVATLLTREHWPGLRILYHKCRPATANSTYAHPNAILTDIIGQLILFEFSQGQENASVANNIASYGLDLVKVWTVLTSPTTPVDVGFKELKKLVCTSSDLNRGYFIIIDRLDIVHEQSLSLFLAQLADLGKFLPVLIRGTKINMISKRHQDMMVISESTEFDEYLSSLRFAELNLRRDRVSQAQSGTNKWIFEHEEFEKWKCGLPSILWIEGKPGSGKSVLAKSLVTHIARHLEAKRDNTTRAPATVVDWFYSRRDGPITMAHISMMRSVIFQILKKHPSEFARVCNIYRTKPPYSEDQGIIWDADNLAFMLKLLLQCSIPIICILDGLDESEDGEQSGKSRDAILTMVKSLSAIVSKRLTKFIVLSRPTNDIKESLIPSARHLSTDIRHIIMQQENKADIEAIVDSGMQLINRALCRDLPTPSQGILTDVFLQLQAREKATLDNICDYLLDNANGVVLWVTLALTTLESRCRYKRMTARELEELMRALPKDLIELYTYLANQIPRDCISKTRDVLMWVSGASIVRALTLEELWEGLTVPRHEEPITADDEDFRVTNGDSTGGNWEYFCYMLFELCSFFVEVIDPKSRELSPASKLHPSSQQVEGQHVVQLVHQTVKDFLANSSLAGALCFTEAEAIWFVKASGGLYSSIMCKRLCRQFEARLSLPGVQDFDLAKLVTEYLADKCLFGFFLRRGLYSTLKDPAVIQLQWLVFGQPAPHENYYLIYIMVHIACLTGCVRNIRNLLELACLDDAWWPQSQIAVLDGAIMTASLALEPSYVRRLMGSWHENISPSVRVSLSSITMTTKVDVDQIPESSGEMEDNAELFLALGSEKNLRKLKDHIGSPRLRLLKNLMRKEELQAGAYLAGAEEMGRPKRSNPQVQSGTRSCIEIIAGYYSGRGRFDEGVHRSKYLPAQ